MNDHEVSLKTYAEGLLEHAEDAGVVDLAALFDDRIDEIAFDEFCAEEVHFQIGYLTCAAELREMDPEELLAEYIGAPQLPAGRCRKPPRALPPPRKERR